MFEGRHIDYRSSKVDTIIGLRRSTHPSPKVDTSISETHRDLDLRKSTQLATVQLYRRHLQIAHVHHGKQVASLATVQLYRRHLQIAHVHHGKQVASLATVQLYRRHLQIAHVHHGKQVASQVASQRLPHT